jgi:hypothetical protein
VTTVRPDHASAGSLATFVCAFVLGPALLRGGLAAIGPADGEAATQEFSIGAGSGKAKGLPPRRQGHSNAKNQDGGPGPLERWLAPIPCGERLARAGL